MHKDAAVETDHVPPPVDERPPPELLDVVFQLDAERPVVPGVGEPTVDIGTWKDEAAPLAERRDLVHRRRATRWCLRYQVLLPGLPRPTTDYASTPEATTGDS